MNAVDRLFILLKALGYEPELLSACHNGSSPPYCPECHRDSPVLRQLLVELHRHPQAALPFAFGCAYAGHRFILQPLD